MRWIASALFVATLLAGGTACAAPDKRTAGCTPPQHEPTLLREYAHDPVFAVTPAGAHRVGGVQQARACKFLDMEDVTVTSATLHMTLSRDYDETGLRNLYEPVATRQGWKADSWDQPNPDHLPHFSLIYCRMVHGVTTALTVAADPNPGGDIIVTIEAMTRRPSCAALRPVAGAGS